jgi:hypothetical protein
MINLKICMQGEGICMISFDVLSQYSPGGTKLYLEILVQESQKEGFILGVS